MRPGGLRNLGLIALVALAALTAGARGTGRVWIGGVGGDLGFQRRGVAAEGDRPLLRGKKVLAYSHVL